MHLADAPAMFQSVLSISNCFIGGKKQTPSGPTTNLRLRDKAKLKTLLVMLAYRTDMRLSRARPCLLAEWCEETVKILKRHYLSCEINVMGAPIPAFSARATARGCQNDRHAQRAKRDLLNNTQKLLSPSAHVNGTVIYPCERYVCYTSAVKLCRCGALQPTRALYRSKRCYLKEQSH